MFKERTPDKLHGCFGHWEDDQAEIEKELCIYVYAALKQLAENKCFCITSHSCPKAIRDKPDDEKTPLEIWRCKRDACIEAWRKFTNKICKAPNGKHNGHTPDACAGGAPNPAGCYLVMDSACNQSMGGQCGNSELPYTRCWNTITFEFWEIKMGPGPDGELETGDDVIIWEEEPNVGADGIAGTADDFEGKPCYRRVKVLNCDPPEGDEKDDFEKILDDTKKKWETAFCEEKEKNSTIFQNYANAVGDTLPIPVKVD